MSATQAITRKPAQAIGSYISQEYYAYLTNGYDQQHPTEQKSLFIRKEYILDTLQRFPHVSGLRFMYGLNPGADASSRTIILMPCNDSSTEKAVPNLILSAKGYLNERGETVGLDQCWDLFNRYVDRMCELMPEEKRNEIPRACFYGIDSLRDLLAQKDCIGIRYHFGYNPQTAFLPKRYEAVMEAVDARLQGLQVFMEEGQHCPPNCPPFNGTVYSQAFPDAIVSVTETSITRESTSRSEWAAQSRIEWEILTPADGALYEMYHNVVPSLAEAVEKSGSAEPLPAQLASLQPATAKAALRQHLGDMMEKYLLKN